jgi:hypothetical protein
MVYPERDRSPETIRLFHVARIAIPAGRGDLIAPMQKTATVIASGHTARSLSKEKDMTSTTGPDIFAGAQSLDQIWNSSAHAVGPDEILWQCDTWGSGRGRCSPEESAIHLVVAHVLNLKTSYNWDARDELEVRIPLDAVERAIELAEALEDTDSWPWHDDDLSVTQKVALAAKALGLSAKVVRMDNDLLDLLRIA